jgi:hypothetical protein
MGRLNCPPGFTGPHRLHLDKTIGGKHFMAWSAGILPASVQPLRLSYLNVDFDFWDGF